MKRATCNLKRPNGQKCNYTLTFADHMEDWAWEVLRKHAAKNQSTSRWSTHPKRRKRRTDSHEPASSHHTKTVEENRGAAHPHRGARCWTLLSDLRRSCRYRPSAFAHGQAWTSRPTDCGRHARAVEVNGESILAAGLGRARRGHDVSNIQTLRRHGLLASMVRGDNARSAGERSREVRKL